MKAIMVRKSVNIARIEEARKSYAILVGRPHVWDCIQKFPDWRLGASIANGTVLCR